MLMALALETPEPVTLKGWVVGVVVTKQDPERGLRPTERTGSEK